MTPCCNDKDGPCDTENNNNNNNEGEVGKEEGNVMRFRQLLPRKTTKPCRDSIQLNLNRMLNRVFNIVRNIQ